MKKVIALFLALVLIFSCSVLSFAAVTDISYPDLKSGWSVSSSGSVSSPSGYTSSWFRYILEVLASSKTVLGSSSDTSYSNTVMGRLTAIRSRLDSAFDGGNSSVQGLLTGISNKLSFANSSIADIVEQGLFDISSDLTFIRASSSSTSSSLYVLGLVGSASWDKDGITVPDTLSDSWYNQLYQNIVQLRKVLADDDDLRMKEESADNEEAFEDNFLTGDNAVGSGDIGSLSGLVTTFRSFLGEEQGLKDVSLTAWYNVFQSDEPLQFFSDGDAVAESMGVEAVALDSPDFSDPDSPGGGGDPIIPPSPPDDSPFPDDGNFYVKFYDVSNAFVAVYTHNGVNTSVSSLGSDLVQLSDGDSIQLRFGIAAGRGYGIVLNGLSIPYDSPTDTFNASFSDNLTVRFLPIVQGLSGNDFQKVTLTFVMQDGQLLLSGSPMLMASRPDSNRVVTSYYQDNLNELWGWLYE